MIRLFILSAFLCITFSLDAQSFSGFKKWDDSIYTDHLLKKHKIRAIHYTEIDSSECSTYGQASARIRRYFDTTGKLTVITDKWCSYFNAWEYNYHPDGTLKDGVFRDKAEIPKETIVIHKAGDSIVMTTGFRSSEKGRWVIFRKTICTDIYGKVIYESRGNGDSTRHIYYPNGVKQKTSKFRNGVLLSVDSFNVLGRQVLGLERLENKTQVDFVGKYLYDSLELLTVLFVECTDINNTPCKSTYLKIYERDSAGNLLAIKWYEGRIKPEHADTTLDTLYKICADSCRLINNHLQFDAEGKLKKQWHVRDDGKNRDSVVYHYFGDYSIELFSRFNETYDTIIGRQIRYKNKVIQNEDNFSGTDRPYRTIIYNSNGTKKSEYNRNYIGLKWRWDWDYEEFDSNGKTLYYKDCSFEEGYETSTEEWYSNGQLIKRISQNPLKKRDNYILNVKLDAQSRIVKETFKYIDSITIVNTYKYNKEGILIEEVNALKGYTRQVYFDKKGLPVKRVYQDKNGEVKVETWEYEFYK